MADSYSSKLQLWEGWMPALVKGPAPPTIGERGLNGPHYRLEFADRLYAGESLHGNGQIREGADPFTLQWFLDIENARHSRQGGWIPRLLEFSKHGGETLLGLGNGLGTDWVQYARHGAEVVACCPSAEQLALIQRNFELRGLRGVFLHANPQALPLESASIDVVCVTNLLQDVPDPPAVISEIYRVLKPGGKALAVTPARFDIDYWRRRCLPWDGWLRARNLQNAPTISFSGRTLRQFFTRFVESRVYKRHLRRSEVPHLWRWLPHSQLERLFGRLLIIKAFKPLSAAMAVQMAA
ncbi:MAG TPA: class I SAM-dependent methyltransferase [Gemmataceae bacterium]|nr:class I SAM-dependent methyltransferase [Gemmataceae bacterium]